MHNLEFEVLTKRHDTRGDDEIMDVHTFVELDAAQAFVKNEPIIIPEKDAGVKWVKFYREIRRTKTPAV